MELQLNASAPARPMIVFPIAVLAVVMCAATVTLAPRPQASHQARTAASDPAADAASPGELMLQSGRRFVSR